MSKTDLQKQQQKWNWTRFQILGGSASLHRIAESQGKSHLAELLLEITEELMTENDSYYRGQGVKIQ